MTKSSRPSLAAFRKTAAVLVAAAAILATGLTPATAQSTAVPGKPIIVSVTSALGEGDWRAGCPFATFYFVVPKDRGTVIIAHEYRTRINSDDRTNPGPWEAFKSDVRGYEPTVPDYDTEHLILEYTFVHTIFAIYPEYVPGSILEVGARVWNSVGAGPWSDAATFELDLVAELGPLQECGDDSEDGTATIPFGVSAIPGDGFVTLSWNAPSSDGASAITSYEVWYRPTGRNSSFYTKETSATSIEIAGLINDVDYEMFVRAENADGSSSWSDAIIVTPVGSGDSPLSGQLVEITDFMDQILAAGNDGPPPEEPVAGDCPRVAKYQAERLGGWWPIRKTRFRIVATESWTLSDGTRLNRGALGGEVKYETASLSLLGCSWAFPGSKIEDGANVRGDVIVRENARVANRAQISGSAVIGGGDGRTFVGGDARVSGNAQVFANARLWDMAQVYGNASVHSYAQVFGDARIYGNAEVSGVARVHGDSGIYGNAEVSGAANVYGDARIYGNARLYGEAEVCGDAKVHGTAVIFQKIRVCSGEYDGHQEYAHAAEEMFRKQYEEYYGDLLVCEGGDQSAAHEGAIALASMDRPDLAAYVEATLQNCDRLERLRNVVGDGAPQGWHLIVAVASTFSWPTRIGVVLNVATLASSLGTLQAVKDRLGEKTGQDASDMDEKLREAYNRYVRAYAQCSGNLPNDDCF